MDDETPTTADWLFAAGVSALGSLLLGSLLAAVAVGLAASSMADHAAHVSALEAEGGGALDEARTAWREAAGGLAPTVAIALSWAPAPPPPDDDAQVAP